MRLPSSQPRRVQRPTNCHHTVCKATATGVSIRETISASIDPCRGSATNADRAEGDTVRPATVICVSRVQNRCDSGNQHVPPFVFNA